MDPQQLYELWERQPWSAHAIDLEARQGGVGRAPSRRRRRTSSPTTCRRSSSARSASRRSSPASSAPTRTRARRRSSRPSRSTRSATRSSSTASTPRCSSATARSRTRLETARADVNEAFIQLFDVELVNAQERLLADPARHRGQGRLRRALPHGHRGDARADRPALHPGLPREARASSPACSRATSGSRRTSTATSPTAPGSSSRRRRTRRSSAASRPKLMELMPLATGRARPARRRGPVRLRDPRLPQLARPTSSRSTRCRRRLKVIGVPLGEAAEEAGAPEAATYRPCSSDVSTRRGPSPRSTAPRSARSAVASRSQQRTSRSPRPPCPRAAQTQAHFHRASEELYVFTAGRAGSASATRSARSRAGDCVVLPPGTEHKLWNTGDGPLKLLCCCAPAYSHDDTVITE